MLIGRIGAVEVQIGDGKMRGSKVNFVEEEANPNPNPLGRRGRLRGRHFGKGL